MAVSPDHLAEWITWTGVAVAIIGAAEAAPAGSAALGRAVRRFWHRVRAQIARLIPRLRLPPAQISASGSMNLKGSILTVTVDTTRWDPDAPVAEQVQLLHRRLQQVEQWIPDSEQRSRDLLNTLRSEHQQAIGEIRAAQLSIGKRLNDMEAREARTDARGIIVVAGGILLTGLAAQLALYWPAAALAVAIVLVVTGRVGFLVRDDRRG